MSERKEYTPDTETTEVGVELSLKVLAEIASEWKDLEWQSVETMTAIRDEASQTAKRDVERLKRLQVSLEEIRLKQQRLLSLQTAIESELFTRLGL